MGILPTLPAYWCDRVSKLEKGFVYRARLILRPEGDEIYFVTRTVQNELPVFLRNSNYAVADYVAIYYWPH